MLDMMYELPSRKDVAEVWIDEGVIEKEKAPTIRYQHQKKAS